jgi:hypothetical protein
MGTDGNNLMKTPPHLWWVCGNIWLGGIQEIKAGLISSLPKREKMLLVVDKNKAPRLRGSLLYRFPFLLIAAVSHASGKEVKDLYIDPTQIYRNQHNRQILSIQTIL